MSYVELWAELRKRYHNWNVFAFAQTCTCRRCSLRRIMATRKSTPISTIREPETFRGLDTLVENVSEIVDRSQPRKIAVVSPSKREPISAKSA